MDAFKNLPWRIQEPAMLDRIPEFITEEYLKQSYVFNKSTEMLIKEHKKHTVMKKNPKDEEIINNDKTENKPKNKSDENKFQNIPGYRKLPENKSNLTINQHKMCLDIMIKMQQGKLKTLPLQKKKLLEKLDSKIREERILYSQLAEENWKQSGFMKLNEIHKDLSSYYNEYWTKSCERIFKYPNSFNKPTMIPLMQTESEIEIHFVQNLIEQGDIPLLNIPKQIGKKRIILQKNNSSMNAIASIKLEDKKTVSKDSIAEELAQNHNIDIVISSSALKKIVDNYPPFTNSWYIPITIKEYETTDVKGLIVKKKILYIDKPFPKNPQTAADKNEWVFKKLVKPILIKGIGYSFPCTEINSHLVKNEKQNVDKLEISSVLTECPLNVCTDCMDVYNSECKNNNENTSIISNESEDQSNLTEDPLHEIQCLKNNSENGENKGSEIVRRSTRKRKSAEMRNTVTNDTSKSNILENTTNSLEQTTHIPISSINTIKKPNCNLKRNMQSNIVISDIKKIDACKCEMKLRIKQNSKNDIKNELLDIKNSLSASKSNNEKDCDIEISTNTSEVTNENNIKVEVNIKAENENIDKSKKHKMGSIWGQISETMSKQNSFNNKRKEAKNVTYRLWHLKPNLIKNDLMNQEYAKYSLLVRSQIDACEKLPNNIFQSVVIAPKIEYQLEYGAECSTKSEICKQWLSLLIRPYSSLLRVRVDPTTSDVLVTQRSNLANLFMEASLYNFNPNKGLNIFYSIVNKLLTFSSGQYLLSHVPRNASFAEVRRLSLTESEDTFNLHQIYEKNNQSISPVTSWIPLDTNIILPNNVFQRVLPGLFKTTNKNENQHKVIRSKKAGVKKKKSKINSNKQ